jgi:tRNA G18 (ribose-2'-O)-methylase SpoU
MDFPLLLVYWDLTTGIKQRCFLGATFVTLVEIPIEKYLASTYRVKTAYARKRKSKNFTQKLNLTNKRTFSIRECHPKNISQILVRLSL